ncbi:uncharacterized protein BP5553_01876 [Venustampulla echinocandica]|uniref:Major facilitator superfamily (MFS) profile domain-containing protein n=1 Tax=Venustampulla echinocandica TaxID=2656787 RepID=A0A370U298_9HELO|nr:uncharacterized protein BP5553_01876 [Venustampulla echinocandica]RDL41897.1 hypothetical protein BP5553_01876 [Venustampulla echinocandica]
MEVDENTSGAGIGPKLLVALGSDDQTKSPREDAHEPTSASTGNETRSTSRIRTYQLPETLWRWITWTPKRCRWDPDTPPEFSMWLNLLFGFAGTFTVANLYYNHPILNILAVEFHVTDERSSLIPTVMQAGYAAGLLFLCPLGDLFRRRAFVLILVFFTATVWLGLCVTNSFAVFLVLSFITAVSTVTPQLMLPLVGELAPPHRRAMALSIVVSGLLLGMLLARLLAGVLTQHTSWRSIYWFSFGMQYLIFILLFFFMPDYPSTNPGGLNYFGMLWSIVQMVFQYPVLVQACLVGFTVSSTFTSFWTTLTFLLASPPYSYSPTTIGLFALIGIGTMCFGPLYAKVIIDRLTPLISVMLGLTYVLIGQALGTFLGPFSISGPIVQAFLLDFGLQTSQIANRSAIYAIAPKARNRINTAYMVSVFCGQLTGTAVGNRLYAEGGWRLSGGVSMGFIGVGLVVCLLRGPWEKKWIGWRGGWGWRRRDLGPNGSELRKEEPPVERVLDEISAEEEGKGSDSGEEKGKQTARDETIGGELLKQPITK